MVSLIIVFLVFRMPTRLFLRWLDVFFLSIQSLWLIGFYVYKVKIEPPPTRLLFKRINKNWASERIYMIKGGDFCASENFTICPKIGIRVVTPKSYILTTIRLYLVLRYWLKIRIAQTKGPYSKWQPQNVSCSPQNGNYRFLTVAHF